MPVQHRTLPDSELHEPKGAALAPPNTVYVANGSGSGSFQRVPVTGLQGLNDPNITDRRIVTAGGNGFKLAPDNVVGQLYYNYGVARPFGTVSYTPGVLSNTTQNGNKIQINYTGTYRVSFAGNLGPDVPETPPATAYLTTDGTNRLGSQMPCGGIVILESVVFLSSNTEIWVELTSSGLSNMISSNGSLVVQLLSS